MFCPHCAKEIPDDAVICVGCGRAVQPLRQSISQPTSQSMPQQGWSDNVVTFLLFGSALLPIVGIVAGIVGLFKAETRRQGISILVFGVAVTGAAVVMTPIGGVIFGLVFATIGFITGKGKATGIYARTTASSRDAKQASFVTKVCPQCAETIAMDALVCRFCGHQFTEDEIANARQLAQEKGIQAQNEGKEKSYRNWSWTFAIAGGILALIGAFSTLMMIFYAFSTEAADSVRTSGAMAVIAPFICTVPMLAAGAGLLFLGIKRIRPTPILQNNSTR